jgi:hypothetical protein
MALLVLPSSSKEPIVFTLDLDPFNENWETAMLILHYCSAIKILKNYFYKK